MSAATILALAEIANTFLTTGIQLLAVANRATDITDDEVKAKLQQVNQAHQGIQELLKGYNNG